jgi:hypothetical protein
MFQRVKRRRIVEARIPYWMIETAAIVCPNLPPFYRIMSLLPALRCRKRDPSD